MQRPPSCEHVRLRAQGKNRPGVRILASTLRAALFIVVGVVWCLRSLQSFADPEYMDPESVSDWFAVLSFSAGLLALAVALPMFARLIGGRVVFRVSLVPAAGAALAGVGNLFEDALHWAGPPGSSGWAFWLFVLGTAVTLVGLIALALVVAVVGRGRRRLLAAVPAATLIGLMLFESGGGVLILAAWLAAAAMALGRPARTVAPAVAISP